MITYDKISIRILADEELIDSPNELGLSDRAHEFEIKLEEWLADEAEADFPEFDFVVE